jgi:hypothetical protein
MKQATARFFAFIVVIGSRSLDAEQGKLLVQVEDIHHSRVLGAEIGIDGIGTSALTNDQGKALLSIASGGVGDWISLSILHSPSGKHLVMVSPWDNRAEIPSFENKPENFVRVVVMEQGERVALEDGTVLASLMAKIIKATTPKASVGEPGRPGSPHGGGSPQVVSPGQEDPKADLALVAKQYGLSPDDLDAGIRAWGAKVVDPYEVGLAALYERNFPAATTKLRASLEQREAKLAADQKTAGADQKQVADAAFFLGSSLYEQGHYRESVQAYQRCLQIRADDPAVLNNTALSLKSSGNYAGAEPLYRRALAIREKAPGPDHPDVATGLNNLGVLLYDKSDYAGAEPLEAKHSDLRRLYRVYAPTWCPRRSTRC